MTDPTPCARCGGGIPAGAAACPTCGSPVGHPSGHTTERVWLPGSVPAGPGGPAGTAGGMDPAAASTVLSTAALPGFAPPRPPLASRDAAAAGLGARFLAALVDGVVLAIPSIVALAVTGASIIHISTGDEPLVTGGTVPDGPSLVPYWLASLVSLLLFVGMMLWEGSSGRTPGKALLGLRTVDVATGGHLGAGRAIVRGLVVLAGVVACYVGAVLVVLSPAFDSTPLRQGWQDKAGRARVVTLRKQAVASAPAGGLAPGLPAPVAARSGADALFGAFPPAPPPAAPFPGAAAQAPTFPSPGPAGAFPAAPGPGTTSFPAAGLPAAGLPATGLPTTGLVTGVPRAAGPVPAGGAPASPVPADGAPASPVPTARPATAPDGFGPHGTVPRYELDLGDGRHVPITGPTLLGRDPVHQPTAADAHGYPGQAPAAPRLVAVPDPQRSVSKTHAELGVDQHGVWLVDRGSTNGTFVTPAGGAEQRVSAGERVRVPVGATVRLGERRLVVVDGGSVADDTVLSVRDLPPQGGGSW